MLKIRFFPVVLAISLFSVSRTSTAGDDASFVEMVTRDRTPVRRAPNRDTAVLAKIYEDTKIEVRRHSRGSDCPEGWYQRPDWGFICGKHLEKYKDDSKLSTEDSPDIREGRAAVIVTEKKVRVYKKSKKSGKLRRIDEILKGSILSGASNVIVENAPYFVTRKGHHVAMENVSSLPPPIDTLAITIEKGAPLVGVVRNHPANVYDTPDELARIQTRLEPWQGLFGAPLLREGDFFRISKHEYIRADSVSLVRAAPPPKTLEANERWIAVDLEAQLLHAYEGERLIRIIPCSTGVEGNTWRGRYRILKKLRQQTMRLRMGKIRVEDVQWVMFYDNEEALAIHSAYWHRDFGIPKSHGCVNVPTDDARWLFEWTAPKVGESDSVTIPLPRDTGTRIVVF